MIFSKQIRAARALLDWNQNELAKRASVGIATIRRLEATDGKVRGNAETVWKIQVALEKAGIQFISSGDSSGVGVRLRSAPNLQEPDL